MTLDRVGNEVKTEDEQPVKMNSVDSAFHHFRPSIRFTTLLGQEAKEFYAELEFDSIKSFDPENIPKKVQGLRSDTADRLRKDLMACLYEQLRPMESSYRQIELFYKNSVVQDGEARPPVELFVLNADAKAMKNEKYRAAGKQTVYDNLVSTPNPTTFQGLCIGEDFRYPVKPRMPPMRHNSECNSIY
jgi:hypothetical protein